MNQIYQYDESMEEVLDRFLFKLDENPIIKTDPIEDSSYLGLTLSVGTGNFYNGMLDEVKKYKVYIKGFVQQNSESPEAYKYVESTLNWLLLKLNKAQTKFEESHLRKDWHMLAHGYGTPNSNKLARTKKDEKNIHQAYLFFYQISKIQFLFIEDLISFISGQLLPITKINRDLDPNIDNRSLVKESKEEYFFIINKQYSRYHHFFISKLHSGLKKHGYVNCTLPDFKKLFIGYSDEKPESSPTPINWTGKHYNSLAYLINQLSGHFITRPKSPSNYKIAINLFHNNRKGLLFTPSKYRYDYNLNRKDKGIIDDILKESWQDLNDNIPKK